MKLSRAQFENLASTLAHLLPALILERTGEGQPPSLAQNRQRLCFDPPDVETVLKHALNALHIEIEA
jgi:hypothetical protein